MDQTTQVKTPSLSASHFARSTVVAGAAIAASVSLQLNMFLPEGRVANPTIDEVTHITGLKSRDGE